jgi:hypothetical protein
VSEADEEEPLVLALLEKGRKERGRRVEVRRRKARGSWGRAL